MMAISCKTTGLARGTKAGLALRCAVLLGLLALQGCITRALWHEEDVPLQLQTVSVPCEVLEVTAAADPHDPSLRVRFAPLAPAGPQYLKQLHSRHAGVLKLWPPVTEGDWRKAPGAEMFAPSSWDLRVTSGTYFRQSSANAQLVFHGVVPAGELGELLRTEQLPPALRQLGGELQSKGALESRCLAGFHRHSWMELLSTPPHDVDRAVPVAWVDGDLNVIETIEAPAPWPTDDGGSARARLCGLRLLGRLEYGSGEQSYVLIGVPVLLQSSEVSLRREGALVHWTRSQVWSARLQAEEPDGAARVPFEVPLRGQSFDYRWLAEREESGLALDALRVLATPVAAVLDFAIETSEPLIRLARFIAGDDKAFWPPTKAGR